MVFMVDKQELKAGLVLFRRTDVKHSKWYCRVKLPEQDRYKSISLNTTDVNAAKEMAFDYEAELRFKVKHDVPVFNKTFGHVAKEFLNHQKQRSQIGEISNERWRLCDSVVRNHLDPYVGNVQITQVGEDRWKAYSTWRKINGKGRAGGMVSNGSIRYEMMIFRAIMRFAADKLYIRESQVFRSAVQSDKSRREEFTPQEYRHLHTFARKWIKDAKQKYHAWYRTITYNFILIMTNTGMRPPEARNLRWRDVAVQSDKHRRKFVTLSVRGKGKFRTLVAAENVVDYFNRIRSLSKATEPDDHVFTTFKGKPAKMLYRSLIQTLLNKSGLKISSSGKRRSTYCFRHTYATFRLTEGVDVYFLAKQMGTSVKMIEDYYGHITPVKNADRILQGLPGWEQVKESSGETASGVNADAAGTGAKPRARTKRKGKDLSPGRGGAKHRPASRSTRRR